MRGPLAADGTRRRPSSLSLRRRSSTVVVVTFVAATTVVMALVFAGRGEPVLELADPSTGEVLTSRKVAVGELLVLTHTHSVTRREVIERFSVDGEHVLTLESMEFDQPGPNLPTGPERFGEQMTTFQTIDGVYRVDHHGYPIGSVTLRAGGADVDHTLTFGDGQQVRLLELTRAGGPVELRVAGES